VTILDKLFAMNLNLNTLMLDMTSYVSEYDYDCLPIGALPFAAMGCDGVHYCIIKQDGDETLENSPVYHISPMDFSSGTVMWAAKNFSDFISITCIIKDAWALPSLANLKKEDFDENLETTEYGQSLMSDEEKMNIENDICILKKNFPVVEISDLYSYINEAYSDIKNHACVKFSEPDIKEIELGHYAYGE